MKAITSTRAKNAIIKAKGNNQKEKENESRTHYMLIQLNSLTTYGPFTTYSGIYCKVI